MRKNLWKVMASLIFLGLTLQLAGCLYYPGRGGGRFLYIDHGPDWRGGGWRGGGGHGGGWHGGGSRR